MEVDLDELQGVAQAVNSAKASVSAIESIFTEKVSASQAPNLSELNKLLQHIGNELNEHLSRRGVSEEQAQEQSETGETSMASQPATAISGDVRSREDVIRMLDKICDYYKQNEPSSPLPLLLQRAKRLVRKDFMEILKDIAPEGVKQAELIGGGDE
jgi:type VI secretion system protein ImpA